MNDWPPQFKLITILATTQFLLSRSETEGWGFEKPKDIESQVHQILCFLLGDQDSLLPEHYTVLFAPTGPLQEISISNGWSEIFLKLAEEFDKLEYLIKEKQI
jgi:hypothetical protein